MNENRKRGTSNNKILTAIAIASLFIGSSKIMAIETYSENSFGVTEQMQAQTARGIVVDQNEKLLSSEQMYFGKRYYQWSYHRLIR